MKQVTVSDTHSIKKYISNHYYSIYSGVTFLSTMVNVKVWTGVAGAGVVVMMGGGGCGCGGCDAAVAVC